MSIGDHAAFPLFEDGEVLADGLSKRELFAAMALQGFCANPHFDFGEKGQLKEAARAVYMADALISYLEDPEQ